MAWFVDWLKKLFSSAERRQEPSDSVRNSLDEQGDRGEAVLQSEKPERPPVYVDRVSRSDIIAWRNQCLSFNEIEVRKEYAQLVARIEKELETCSLVKLGDQQRFHKEQVQPLINESEKQVIVRCMAYAEDGLRKIPGIDAMAFDQPVDYEATNPDLDAQAGLKHGAGSLFMMGAGAAAVPVTASVSTVSAGGLMGLLGATAVSIPIAMTGGTFVVLMVGYGLFRAARSRPVLSEEYLDKVEQSLRKNLFAGRKSVVRQLNGNIKRVSQGLLARARG